MPLRHVDGCFGCSTSNPASLRIALRTTADGVEGVVTFGPEAEGAPGLVHGGLLATFADEVMGYVQYGGAAVRLTAELTTRYRRPTPIGTELRCRAHVVESTDRRCTVHAVITTPDDDTTVLAEADAIYVLVAR
jgi:uncharacterized protein (TIGR00369 family)